MPNRNGKYAFLILLIIILEHDEWLDEWSNQLIKWLDIIKNSRRNDEEETKENHWYVYS